MTQIQCVGYNTKFNDKQFYEAFLYECSLVGNRTRLVFFNGAVAAALVEI